MAYNALNKIRERNKTQYGIEESVFIPALPKCNRRYGRDALAFIRDWCEDLGFDQSDSARIDLTDRDGKSSGKAQIPYNMEKDLDRLSFERAIGRFLASGAREDAFDIYYCYCEIFQPFGAGYDTTGLLLKLLSEHETNASSLLMKHRDHYSHSVYVFLIGLAFYRNHAAIREAYNAKYNLTQTHEAACHFLKYWGMTALFHDIGYPFEIAHQQMKAYVCLLDEANNDENGFAPYVSYKNMERFCDSPVGDLNDLYTEALTTRLSLYMEHAGIDAPNFEKALNKALKDRGVHADPAAKEYLFMDHAYFSALTLMKTYLKQYPEIQKIEQISEELLDSFCAIILHNSLFKFSIRGMLQTKAPFGLADGQPLAYLLMLCDELQCWDRASYGQNSRSGIFAYDFDLTFTGGKMRWTYYFDKAYSEKVKNAKAYKDMLHDGYTKKSGAVRKDRSKFVDDIDEIVRLFDVCPDFEPEVTKEDPSELISVKITPKKKSTGLLLSNSTYLNLYRFALALNGRYCGTNTQDEMRNAFSDNLSLEYKLSNIAQAKGFAARLEQLGMFFTDRAVDYEPVLKFNKNELRRIAEFEHERWVEEKLEMGWNFGKAHVGRNNGKNDNEMRERTRLHHDIIPFSRLTNEEVIKDYAPMQRMLELIKEFDGLTIYRV